MNPKSAPLFNYRKRQRQSIISDPSQHSLKLSKPEQPKETGKSITPNKAPDSSLTRKHVAHSGLMDIKGSFKQKTLPSTSRVTTQSSFPKANVQAGWSSRGSSFNSQNNQDKGYKSSLNTINQEKNKIQSNSLSAGYNDKQYLDAFNNDFFPNDNANIWSKNNLQPNKGRLSATSGSCATINSIENRSSFYRNTKSNSALTSKPLSSATTTSRNQQQPYVQSFPSEKQNAYNRNSSCLSAKPGVGRSLSSSSTSIFCDNPQKDSQKGKHISKVKEVDTSMRVFTCNISTILDWTARRPAPMAIFEIFGIIDSAVMRTRDGTGKEFLLSDNHSKIKCIFYEIDRELTKITRGKVHRVIGRIGSQDKLIVLSIRGAADGEKQIWDIATETSKKEMDLLIHEQ